MSDIEYDTRGLPQFVPRQALIDAVMKERYAIANYISQRRFVCMERQVAGDRFVQIMNRDNESLAKWIRDGHYAGAMK